MKVFFGVILFLTIFLTTSAFGASVVRTIDAPDTNISGLAFGNGMLWALDETTYYLWAIDPEDGTILEQFYVEHSVCPTYTPGGLGFSDDILFCGFGSGNSSARILKYSISGDYLGNIYLC